jgi:hypothetical protein
MGEHRDWDAVLEPRPSNPDEPRGRGTRPWTARRPAWSARELGRAEIRAGLGRAAGRRLPGEIHPSGAGAQGNRGRAPWIGAGPKGAT